MSILYRYFSLTSDVCVERVIKVLDGWVYFANPTCFNDPFEMSPVAAPPTKEAFLGLIERVVRDGSVLSNSAKLKMPASPRGQVLQNHM